MRALFRKSKKSNDRGAIIVEATISFSFFIFTIYTILSIVNIAYIQSKMTCALDAATKEISQYAYLYYKVNLNEAEANLHSQTAESRMTVEQTIQGVETFMDSVSEAENSLSSADLQGAYNAMSNGANSAKSVYELYREQLSDPKQFIVGMAKLTAEEAKEFGKSALGGVMIKAFMQKNLVASSEDTVEDFLARHRVVGGIDGLDFSGTSLMAYGESNEIQVVMSYKVKAVDLLNIDYDFSFKQVAKTAAWGNGVSVINENVNKGSGSDG